MMYSRTLSFSLHFGHASSRCNSSGQEIRRRQKASGRVEGDLLGCAVRADDTQRACGDLQENKRKTTASEIITSMEGEKKEERRQYRLREEKPKVMDQFADTIVGVDGVDKKLQQWFPGIYQLDGDTLKICFFDSNANNDENGKVNLERIEALRPTEFKATQRQAIMILKRVK